MNAPLRSTSAMAPHPYQAAFDKIPELSWAQAERLDVGIFWRDDGFGICYRNSMISEGLNADQVQVWLDGFDCAVTGVSVDLLEALIAAEQVIMAMAAQMTDEQKSAATESTSAAGIPDDTGTRRRAAIAAARKAGAA